LQLQKRRQQFSLFTDMFCFSCLRFIDVGNSVHFLLIMFCFSFLLVQKRNKKRPPKTKQPVFGTGISIKLLEYCDEVQHNRMPYHFKSLSFQWNLKAHSFNRT
jgi:hypothetical protein